MSNMIFEMCCLVFYISGLFVLLGLMGLVFDIFYKYIPRFKKWVNNFIGEEINENTNIR